MAVNSNSGGWTGGPWSVADSDVIANCPSGDGSEVLVAGVYTGGHTRNGAADEARRDANAHLIAAAPDLYEALAGLIDSFPLPATANEYELVQSGCDPTEARKIAAAVKALAKARGEQP